MAKTKKLAPPKKLEKKVTLTNLKIDGINGESQDPPPPPPIDR
jgi:hypothetical protein